MLLLTRTTICAHRRGERLGLVGAALRVVRPMGATLEGAVCMSHQAVLVWFCGYRSDQMVVLGQCDTVVGPSYPQ